MSKKNKSIQDKETFTRTSTVVIYKYSSPSSFQLSENKESECQEQFKDLTAQPFWRADTTEYLDCPLYLQDYTYIQVKFARSGLHFSEARRGSGFGHGLQPWTTYTRSPHTCTQVCIHVRHTVLYLYTAIRTRTFPPPMLS